MSNPTSQAIVPAVNDQYWFNYSADLINNGLENRNKAAATIQAFVIWLWAGYTGFASIGFALSGKELSLWATATIALTSASLIAVYAGTVWVQMPVSVAFDPRSPDDIKNVYLKNVISKGIRLKITLGLAFMAAILVAVSLIVASFAKPSKEPEKKTAPSMSASISAQGGDKAALAVTAVVTKSSTVTVQLTPLTPKASSTATSSYVATTDGLVQASIPIDKKIKEATVTVAWNDSDGTHMQLSKKVTSGL